MDKETYIRAVLECNFAGFKDDIIETAVKNIMARDEPKRGRWIAKTYQHKYKNGYWTELRTECSICGREPLHDRFGQEAESEYCPNCGAQMDEEGEE